MFQFTTTTVINANVDYSTGKSIWSAETTNSEHFFVKRVNDFKAENIKAIYKAEAHDAENAKVNFDFDDINKEKETKQYRISIYVGLTQGSNDSRYSNDFSYKGKPFTVDFTWKKGVEASQVVKDLEKTINKLELFVYGDKILKVSSKGDILTLEATDEFQRFRKVSIEEFDPEPHQGLGEYTEVKSLESLTKYDKLDDLGEEEGIFIGKEGFGTYSWILRNLRLPTDMRTRAFGINQDETPIVGAKYDQYTIHYCVNRGILGTNAVGDVVKSLTTHVFYVKEDISADFEAALKQVHEVETVPEKRETDSDSVLDSETEEP